MVWKMALIYLFWCLWRERNNRNFEDLGRPLEEIYPLSTIRCTFGLQPMCTLSFIYDVFFARFSLSI
jgi:hypothetical protein